MKFFYNPISSNSRRALATIIYNGRDDIERVLLDPFKGEHKTPEFLAVNPNGLLPALQDGDFNLWESNAIMQYVSSDSPLWPVSRARYDIARWQFWVSAHLTAPMAVVVFECAYKELMGMGPADQAQVDAAMEKIGPLFRVLNQHFEGRQFLVGDSLTLADFSVGTELSYVAQAQIDLSPYPHVQAWSDRLDQVEAWASTAIRLG